MSSLAGSRPVFNVDELREVVTELLDEVELRYGCEIDSDLDYFLTVATPEAFDNLFTTSPTVMVGSLVHAREMLASEDRLEVPSMSLGWVGELLIGLGAEIDRRP